jgi:hypothetical protein
MACYLLAVSMIEHTKYMHANASIRIIISMLFPSPLRESDDVAALDALGA